MVSMKLSTHPLLIFLILSTYIYFSKFNNKFKKLFACALFTLNDSKFLKDRFRLESKKNNRSTCTIERTNVDAEIKCVHGRVISNYIIYERTS